MKNKLKIKIKTKDIPRLLGKIVVIGKGGYLRLAKSGDKPKYALDIFGDTLGLYGIDEEVLIL